jgi:hypothetical protein
VQLLAALALLKARLVTTCRNRKSELDTFDLGPIL